MNLSAIRPSVEASFANTPFPQVVARLLAAEVASYRVDLIQGQETFYGDGAEAHTEPLPFSDRPPVAAAFDAAAVAASVGAIQRAEIGYVDFLERIMRAGCSNYCAYLRGRKVIYFGRDGDFHVENFPAAR